MNKTEKLELRIKALELAVDLIKRTGKFTIRDTLQTTYNFYDFLETDVEISIKRLGVVE